MSSPSATPGAASVAPEKSYFEQQRDQLRAEIALTMEHLLMNMNTLNRNLESIVAVGREFESVEALWNQFEAVMGRNPALAKAEEEQAGAAGDGDGDETMEG